MLAISPHFAVARVVRLFAHNCARWSRGWVPCVSSPTHGMLCGPIMITDLPIQTLSQHRIHFCNHWLTSFHAWTSNCSRNQEVGMRHDVRISISYPCISVQDASTTNHISTHHTFYNVYRETSHVPDQRCSRMSKTSRAEETPPICGNGAVTGFWYLTAAANL